MEKNKSSKPGDASTSDNTAVFVLPPELLAKLGIDLRNIQNSESAVPNLAEGSDQNIDHNNLNSLPKSRNASSIIETANLMKESVLLSPTFLQTSSNVTPDEEATIFIETVPITDTIPLKNSNVLNSDYTDAKSTSICDQGTPEILKGNAELIKIKPNYEISSKELGSFESEYESVKEYEVENQDGNLILTDVCYQNTEGATISNDVSKTTYPYDEHPDEAYLSDNSNSYSGCSPEMMQTEVDKHKSLNKIKEKNCDVDSDPQILKCIQKVCFPDHAVLPPIDMDSINTEKEFHSDSNITIKDKLSEMITPKQLMMGESFIISGNSDTAAKNPLENVISWTPVDQREKEIRITKIEYDAHNNSIIHINDPLDATTSFDEAKILLVDSECAKGINSKESVSECSVIKLNDFEKCLEKSYDDLLIVKNIEYTVDNCELNQYSCEKETPGNRTKLEHINNQLRNEITENTSKEDENMISVNKNTHQDRVKEIAAYLSQIANERKKMLRNPESNKKHHNIISKAKLDPIKSKLCIQGVEKPGGKLNQKDNLVCSKVLKTYQRNNTRKKNAIYRNVITMSDEVLNSDPFQLSDNYKIEKQDIKVGTLGGQNEFCVCFDFGNLAYYDCEMLYEHIHFWRHKNIKCESEIIYGIYNDDNTVSKKNVDFIEDGHQNALDDIETSGDNICWNDTILNNSDADIETATKGSSISEEASSFSAQKPLKKTVCEKSLSISEMLEDKSNKSTGIISKKMRNPKRSSAAMNEVSAEEDPVAEKMIKCGVCNQLISDMEWKGHKETQHNFIAWKADQEIETSFATIPESAISSRFDKRFTRNSTNLDTDLQLSRDRIHSNTETNDSPMSADSLEKISTSKDVDVTPRSTRKSSTTKMALSKSTIESRNVGIDQTSNNKTEEPSKSRKDLKEIEINMPARSIRKTCKTDILLKLTGISAAKYADTKSTSTSATTSLNTDTGTSAPFASSLKSISVEEESDELLRSTSKSSSNKVDNATKSQKTSNKTQDTFSSKSKRRSSKTELVETTESTEIVINKDSTSSKLVTNTEINNAPPKHTKRATKIENMDLLTKSTENNEITTNKFTDTQNTDFSKVDKVTDKNTAMRLTRKASILETESTVKSTTSLNTEVKSATKIGELLRRKSSNRAEVLSSLSTKISIDTESDIYSESTPTSTNIQTDEKSSTKDTESDIWIVPTNTKTNEKVKSSKRKYLNTKTCKKSDTDFIVTKETTSDTIDEPLRIIDRYSNLKLKETINAKADLGALSTSSKMPPVKMTDDVDGDPNSSTLTTIPSCDDKSAETNEIANSSRLSKKSTNKEFSESPKSMKRSLNTVIVNTRVKKAKTLNTDKQSAPADRPSKISDNEMDKTPKAVGMKTDNNDQTKPLVKPSIMKAVNESVSKKHPTDNVNDTTETNKSTNIDTPISGNTEYDPPKFIRKYSKKIAYTSKPKDTNAKVELPVKSTKPCTLSKSSQEHEETPCLDMAIVDSTMPEKLPTNTAKNDCQTSRGNCSVEMEFEVPAQVSENLTKCGVCEKTVEDSQWIEHISKEHNYLAWRDNEPSLDLDDPRIVKQHLQVIAKNNMGLICSKCGLVRKCAQPYLRHMKRCNRTEKDATNISTASDDWNSTLEQEDDISLSEIKSKKSRRQRKSAVIPPITCGVCNKSVEQVSWIEHIRIEHNYLAWRDDEIPLNLDDEDEVWKHLNYISKYHGGLLCSKCGSKWFYVKKYLLHEKLCETQLNKLLETTPKDGKIEVEIRPVVKCAVCKLDVEGKNWISHIQRAHEYMAWVDGDKPVDVEDPEQVKEHLHKIIKMAGELICTKCGISRKHVRVYIQHFKACSNSGYRMEAALPVSSEKGKYECGVCHKIGKRSEWKEHAMSTHYNIAWKVGDLPINIRNPYAVEKYLKEYQRKYSLTCKNCKLSRTSCYGFYAHIMTCGKTEEELEAVQNVCDICNNRYLCIYRNQHNAWHKGQVFKKELKEKQAIEGLEDIVEEPQDDQPVEKRKAAQKAKKVIENYKLIGKDGKICSCGVMFNNVEEMSQHKCNQKQNDDSDVSVKMEPDSEAETIDDSDVNSIVSEEEEEVQKKKKRQRVGEGPFKITRMSYRVNNYMSYLIQAYRDFCNLHYTSNSLFIEWRNSEFEVVPKDDMPKYLPSLSESCKVRFSDLGSAEWMTYKRFESKKAKGYSMFTGGSIQCMSWAPHNIADETLGNYLAVSTHSGADVPRLGKDERAQHPGLLQLWDFQQFNFLPRCALTLAHEYGTVWAMDWCPSGGRDRVPSDCGDDALPTFRLGLLAIACSNGTAYILAVPCPPAQTEIEHVMYKLKPVAELRLSMTPERQIYQATTINWSQQKGHNVIIVGYSDGTTALYDLNTESPFLKDVDDKVTIYYPFQDKLSENSPITGVGICPTSNESYSVGGYCSTSVTGGTMSGWPAATPSVRCHLAASGAYYSPQWPAAMLTGDSLLTTKSVNEMEWWGGGRRLGAVRGGATCARCGRTLAAAAPAVRLLRSHACYPEIKKQIIATLLMVPIGRKRKYKQNDDLSIVVEPLTYDDAVAKYGLQLSLVPKNEQAAAQKLCSENELFPERFPLSEIVAAAFCPSARFHDKITLATHAGIIFVIHA